MNLAVVNEAVTGMNGVEHEFTEEEKNFVVQFAFRSGSKEDTISLIEALAHSTDKVQSEEIMVTYRSKYDIKPAWVEQVENLLAIDSAQADVIKELGFGESLVMLILTALLAIIIIICGFFIIYTVYFRFLKILIIVPLGAIACSTMAGNRMVSHTMSTYCKYFLSCVFEAVTMALAIVVCNAFINAGLPSFTGSYADWAQTLIYLCEMTFTIAMTVGSVKGAQTLTSKAFGL